jgi:Ran GTPase-activating protein (RanGAP) involved in mRNA processing and transport
MLRRTSKRVKEVVDKMRLPAVVRLSRRFWSDFRNGTAAEKLQFVLRQLTPLTTWCRISTLDLHQCEMNGQDAERLAGVLAQCPALAHLDLCGLVEGGRTGGNQIGPDGAESIAGVLAQCPALAHLDLWNNGIGYEGAMSLAGVLAQCTALTHLNLRYNQIGPGGAESIAGVLAQCTALTHLNLWNNGIGAVGKGRLRASWRGQASGLLL